MKPDMLTPAEIEALRKSAEELNEHARKAFAKPDMLTPEEIEALRQNKRELNE